MEVKIDKNGKITIPKHLRDKYNLKQGISLEINEINSELILKPYMRCSACGKALPESLYERRACAECTPGKLIVIY